MTLAAFTRLLPAGFSMTLADVGSAGGLQDRWQPARPWIQAMLFEPRESGAVRHEGGVLLLNPGSAGPRRFGLPLSVARIIVTDGQLDAELIPLRA